MIRRQQWLISTLYNARQIQMTQSYQKMQTCITPRISSKIKLAENIYRQKFSSQTFSLITVLEYSMRL